MRKNLLLSGGVAHDFPGTSAKLAEALEAVDVATEISEDPADALKHAGEFDLVTVNMLRWSMGNVERYLADQPRWGITLSPEAEAALGGHVRRGGGLLSMHGAPICFDTFAEWPELLGAEWNWERSMHPPLATVELEVTGGHAITDGLESFSIEDETYSYLEKSPDVHGLLFAHHTGESHPLLWARSVGDGRSVYDALGHQPSSYDQPVHRTIVQRAALWALGDPDSEVGRVLAGVTPA